MSKKNKKFTIELYTNQPLSAARTLFGPGVYENRVAPLYNNAIVRLCAPSRHRMCVRDKQCDNCAPRNNYEARMLLGVSRGKSSHDPLSEEERKKFERLMLGWVKRCRKVTMTIEEGAND